MHGTSKPKLLAIGQGLAPTGFARVLDSLLIHLVDRWEVHHFALHYRGPHRDEPWTVHPNDRRGDVYGLTQLGPLLESVRPDVVLILEDPASLPLHLEIVARHGHGAGTAVYCPMDFDIPPGMAADIAVGADRVVAYTEAGRRSLVEAGLPGSRVDVLPHGIDPCRFRPLGAEGQPDRVLARRLLFGSEVGAEDFLVLNANRNQPRKRIDLTLEGFARFAADKPPSVRLCLHMGMRDQGIDVLALAGGLGILDRLVLTTREPGRPAVPDDRLNLIYNACDVGLNTALAEGWGLVAFEHAATGAAQVVPGHGACRELWEGSALLLDALASRDPRGGAGERTPTAEGVAAALETLYRDPGLRHRLAAAARANATRPDLTWSAVALRWHRLLSSLLTLSIERKEMCHAAL